MKPLYLTKVDETVYFLYLKMGNLEIIPRVDKSENKECITKNYEEYQQRIQNGSSL